MPEPWSNGWATLHHGDARHLPQPLISGPVEPPERLEPAEAENVRLAAS